MHRTRIMSHRVVQRHRLAHSFLQGAHASGETQRNLASLFLPFKRVSIHCDKMYSSALNIYVSLASVKANNRNFARLTPQSLWKQLGLLGCDLAAQS